MSSYLEWKKRAIIMSSGGWWLPPNFDLSDCLAAYQFKGAGSEASALSDLTGNGKTLTKTGTVTFDNNTGYTFAAGNMAVRSLNNTEVTDIKSVIIRYSFSGGVIAQMAYSVGYDNAPFDSGDPDANNFGMVGITSHWNVAEERFNPLILRTNTLNKSGVFGFNLAFGDIDGHTDIQTESVAGSAYYNGQKKNLVNVIAGHRSHVHPGGVLFGNTDGAWGNLGAFTIQAGAFYKRNLTAAEMSYIYDQVSVL